MTPKFARANFCLQCTQVYTDQTTEALKKDESSDSLTISESNIDDVESKKKAGERVSDDTYDTYDILQSSDVGIPQTQRKSSMTKVLTEDYESRWQDFLKRTADYDPKHNYKVTISKPDIETSESAEKTGNSDCDDSDDSDDIVPMSIPKEPKKGGIEAVKDAYAGRWQVTIFPI